MTHVDAATQPRPPRKRGKKLPRHPYDRRTLIGRRITSLVAVFRSKLGTEAGDPVVAAAIMRCAEVTALSEDMRARMLRGEKVSADDTLRLSRTADLLTRKLNLDRHKLRDVSPTLSDILREEQDGAPKVSNGGAPHG